MNLLVRVDVMAMKDIQQSYLQYQASLWRLPLLQVSFLTNFNNCPSQTMQTKKSKQPLAAVHYCLKPKSIINTPLNKYDLSSIQSDPTLQITDHFNYGFNNDTFPLYAKLCKRFAQAEELHSRPPYNPNENGQFKFNDEMPMDLGGFGPFLDKESINIWQDDSLENSDALVDYFVRFNFCMNNVKKSPFTLPMTEFVRLMNGEGEEDNLMRPIVECITERFEEKYDKTIEALRKKEQRNVVTKKKEQAKEKEKEKDKNFYDNMFGNEVQREEALKRQDMKETLSQSKSNLLSLSSIDSCSIDSNQDFDINPPIKKQVKPTSEDLSSDEESLPSRKSHRKSHKKHHKKSKSRIRKHKSHKKHKKHGKKSKKHHK